MKPDVKEKFQVSMVSEQFIVDLVARACSCRWWTLTSNTTFIFYFIMFDNLSKVTSEFPYVHAFLVSMHVQYFII